MRLCEFLHSSVLALVNKPVFLLSRILALPRNLWHHLRNRTRPVPENGDLEAAGLTGVVGGNAEPESRGIPRVITYRHVHIGPGDEPPILRYGEVIYKAKGKFLAREGTAFIELLPCGEVVVKTPTPDPFYPREEEDHRNHTRLETQVYQRIGPHASIPKLVSWDPVTFCLTLEYLAHGNLRDYVRSHTGTITPDLRWKWAWQAAQGPCVLHDADVIHCDISPRNFLLDTDLDLKISDFGGSSPYGSVPAAFASTRYRRPGYIWDDPPHVNDDIFGLGSLLYFIMTGMVPYEEVPSDEVVARYTRLEFPDVSHLSCGDIIQQCWNSKVDARQVYDFPKNGLLQRRGESISVSY